MATMRLELAIDGERWKGSCNETGKAEFSESGIKSGPVATGTWVTCVECGPPSGANTFDVPGTASLPRVGDTGVSAATALSDSIGLM